MSFGTLLLVIIVAVIFYALGHNGTLDPAINSISHWRIT